MRAVSRKETKLNLGLGLQLSESGYRRIQRYFRVGRQLVEGLASFL